MCGIVASVSSQGRVSSDALLRATQRLRHRGPDAQRVWVPTHARVGLGHARLSIIDLATGDQPIASEDGSLHIVANGEFYDFEAIREELESRGHSFRTRSDSEIALHLYEDAGARCLRRLRGEFAFAIWDDRDGLLFAGRDRFGIKPLYYVLHGGACHVVSEVKALPELGVPLRWDHDTVFDLHRGLMHPPSESAFAGIHQVPPGCYLVTDGTSARVLPYWDWDYPFGPHRVGPQPARVGEEARRSDAANTVSQGLLLPTGSGGPIESVRRTLGFVPTIMETWAQQGQVMTGLLDDDFKARYRCRDTFRVLLNHLDVERQLVGRDPVNQALYLWAKTALPNYILSNLGDRMEMAHSVEGRLPLLDQ